MNVDDGEIRMVSLLTLTHVVALAMAMKIVVEYF